MRVALTGATGFTGSKVRAFLAEDGHEVFAVHRGKKPAAEDGVVWIRWDLSKDALPRAALPEKVDAVAHLAQSPRYAEFPAGMPDMTRVNVNATAELLDYAVAAGATSFVLTSTGSVYEASHEALSEDSSVRPASGYAASKLAAEMLCEPYREFFSACVLRPFNIYGPGQGKMLMTALANRVREGRPIDLIGGEDGFTLTPTYVDDAARTIEDALLYGWNETLNLAGPQTITFREVGETLGEILGEEPHFNVREGEAASRFADVSLLGERMELRDFIDPEDGLRRMFAAA